MILALVLSLAMLVQVSLLIVSIYSVFSSKKYAGTTSSLFVAFSSAVSIYAIYQFFLIACK